VTTVAPAPTTTMGRSGPAPRRLGVRRRGGLLLCLLIVLVDQATKAVQPAGTFYVNTGGWSILPSALGNVLWSSQRFGAACDTIDTILLLAGLGMAVRLANTRQRLATTALLAGLLSNLVDRLGAASLFHPGLARGAIDWIPVPAWSTATTINIADIVIVLAALALAYQPARRAIQAIQVLVRHSSAERLAAAAAGLIAVAIWTTAWQTNRHNAEMHPTPPSDTLAACTPALRTPTAC
jgi:lipoprotein signal peptidase